MVHAHTATGPSPSPARYPTRFASRMHLSPQPTASAAGQAFPRHHARNPRRVSHTHGLAIIRFRSPLLTEYPLLQVLRCFTSLRTPAQVRCQPMTAGGLPHSDTPDQSHVGGSPIIIAAPHVLHRYCLPRHPPYAHHDNHNTAAMTKALLKNPRTTSDHGDAPHTARPHTIRTNPRKTIPRIRITVRTPTPPTTGGPMLASTIQFSNHHPIRTPTPHQQAPGSQPGGTHRQPHPPHGGRWRPGTQQHAPHHHDRHDRDPI